MSYDSWGEGNTDRGVLQKFGHNTQERGGWTTSETNHDLGSEYSNGKGMAKDAMVTDCPRLGKLVCE